MTYQFGGGSLEVSWDNNKRRHYRRTGKRGHVGAMLTQHGRGELRLAAAGWLGGFGNPPPSPPPPLAGWLAGAPLENSQNT